MKDQILKIAKVKSEKEFYKKYPTEESFMKAHGKALKKAEMGTKMVNTQLHQLTDFGNPPIAQNGMGFNDLLANANATNQGISRKQYDEQLKEDAARQTAMDAANAKSSSGGIGSQIGSILGKMMPSGGGSSAPSLDFTTIDTAPSFQEGGELPIFQGGGTTPGGFNWGNLGTALGTATQGQGGLGSEFANIFGGKGTANKLTNVGPQGALGQGGAGFGAGSEAAGIGIVNAAPQILQGVQQIKQQKQNMLKADQAADISGLTLQAASGRKERVQNKYVRPEDQLLQPGQMGSPTGVGTNYLAQYGTRISGNPTQVQNTYAPNNLYGDLGYEPLEESNPKQYRRGGVLPQAEFGDYFQSSGQASIGSGVGSAIGSAFFGPVGGEVGKLVGTVAGNLLGGAKDANALKAKQAEAQTNAMRAAWASGAQGIQGQNASFMEDGGKTSPYEWNSHTWQPQLITKFGEHNLKDLLHPPHDADMLRSGGHLKEDYVNPSASALSTERGLMPIAEDGTQLAMGGDLQVHRGKAETLSYNPFLPHGGETIMFRGPSHDNGGMPVTYGDNGVEVEGGEPATKLQDGGSPTGSNLVVYGNMKIPQFGASEIGDKDSEGRKFKHYANDVALNDKKQNQIINKATDIVNSSKDNTVFDQLALNSGKAMMMGATAKQKANAAKLEAAARVQNAILDTAKEFGYEDSDKFNQDVMKGKVKNMAKLGASIPMAQNGIGIGEDYYLDHTGTQSAPQSDADAADARMQALGLGNQSFGNADLGNVAVASSKRGPAYPSLGYTNAPTTFTGATSPVAYPYPKEEDLPGLASPTKDKGTKKFDKKNAIATALASIYDFARPTNQMPLDTNQLMGEMYALGHNQVEPVKAQTYQPMLDTPYNISLQDQINSIDQQANAAIRGAGRNPAAQAQIMASAAEMKNKVLGEQFRANQAQKAQVYGKNRDLMNQAQLQNLNILDQQYVRQATAQSKTKEQNIAALNSISSKIAQNKLENLASGVEQNKYNFRFDPTTGKAYNVNSPATFNIPTAGEGTPSVDQVSSKPSTLADYEKAKAMVNQFESQLKKDTKPARNGAIVKALKTI